MNKNDKNQDKSPDSINLNKNDHFEEKILSIDENIGNYYKI
jgi:hypothetical protein